MKDKRNTHHFKFNTLIYNVLFVILSIVLISYKSFSQLVAFPGAEGFGKYATGGRGGMVIEVTNLNDAGAGSFRRAIEQNGTRTIVFRVSGTIYLKSALNISYGNLTIAGQTAPGDGITLANYYMNIKASNVIIRYIRCRLGDVSAQQTDAFTCRGTKNVIVDHCTFSWSVDEAASAYENENFTMQWCMISESLNRSVHVKGDHGYGGIWGGNHVSFHHNLLAHHNSRNPRFNGAREKTLPWNELVDHRNNVIYNWGSNSAYAGEPSNLDGSKAHINIVHNYYKAGPGTSSGAVRYRIFEPYKQETNNAGYSLFYIDSNFVAGNQSATNDNWGNGVQNVSPADKILMKSDSSFAFDISTFHTAQEAYKLVLEGAGCTLPRRDTVDKRIIWEVRNDTALYGGFKGAHTGIIDSQNDVGGYPELYSAYPPDDSDRDGIPDFWEKANGLDPLNSTDKNNIDKSGYTMLEIYLNSIVFSSSFLRPPSNIKYETIENKEVKLTWKDNSNIEDGFVIQKKNNDVFTTIDTVKANSNSYIDKNVNPLLSYDYRLFIFKNKDSSVYSNIITVVFPKGQVKPSPSANPYPTDGSSVLAKDLVLKWDKGDSTKTHDLYFGTTNPPAFVKNIDINSIIPENLSTGTTYYWRIDEVNEAGKTEGKVWQFKIMYEIPRKLVGYWNFDNPPSVSDLSGYNNNGILMNMDETNFKEYGVINKGLYFNGLDEYVKIVHNEVYNFHKNDFSISFWLYQDTTTLDNAVEYRYIIKGSNTKNDATARSGKRYEIYYSPAKNLFRFAIDDDVVKSEIAVDKKDFIKNKWVHIVAIRDTISKLIKLYADSKLISSIADLTGDISEQEDLYFGYNVDFGSYHNGGLDEVKLFGYALSQKSIDSLFLEGTTKTHINLVADDDNNLKVFPNPSSGQSFISFLLPREETVTLSVYNLQGRKIMSLFEKQRLPHGNYTFQINQLSENHNVKNEGMYLIFLSTLNRNFIKKLIIIK